MGDCRSPYMLRLRSRKFMERNRDVNPEHATKPFETVSSNEAISESKKTNCFMRKTPRKAIRPRKGLTNTCGLPCMSTQPVMQDTLKGFGTIQNKMLNSGTPYPFFHKAKSTNFVSLNESKSLLKRALGVSGNSCYINENDGAGELCTSENILNDQYIKDPFIQNSPEATERLHGNHEPNSKTIQNYCNMEIPEFLMSSSPLMTFCSRIRCSMREAYQNPAASRLELALSVEKLSQTQQNYQEPEESFHYLIQQLNQCRVSHKSFFLLLLGAPDSEKGTMVSTAVNASMKNFSASATALHKTETNPWRLVSVVVPSFCCDDVACLKYFTKSLFNLSCFLSSSGLIEQNSFTSFIANATGDWALAVKPHIKRKPRKSKKGESSVNSKKITASGPSLRLKCLTYRQWIELFKHLLHYLNLQNVIPIITIEYFDCFALRKAQHRQSLLYNLFNLVYSGIFVCGFVACSSLLNISCFFEKRIQSRYNLSHLHFVTSSSKKIIVSFLPSYLGFPDVSLSSLNPSTKQVIQLLETLLKDSSVEEMIDFYIASDHRALQLVLLTVTQQLLTLIPSLLLKVNSSISKYHPKGVHCTPSRGTPLKRRKSESRIEDNVSSAISTPSAHKTSPCASKLSRSSTLHSLSVGKHQSQVEQRLPPFPLETSQNAPTSKHALTIFPLDWNLEYHEMILPHLSLSELLFLSVMTYLHKKRIACKTLQLVYKEIYRVEKMCLVSRRWTHDTSQDYIRQHKFRLVRDRLLSLKILEPSLNVGLSRLSNAERPVKYPGYLRFLNFYPKLYLPTHVERYLQSA